jgi:hypothetical protein
MPPIWKNGMLEYWNIVNKSGDKLFKWSKNPLNSSFLPCETFFYFTGAITPLFHHSNWGEAPNLCFWWIDMEQS